MTTAADAALRGTVTTVAVIVDLALLSLIAALVRYLLSKEWSLKDAMSEALPDPTGTGASGFRMAASSSRLTAMIGTILFTILSAHCIGFVIGSLVAGQTPDLKWAENLFLAIGGFFAPYAANKVAGAFAGGPKTSLVGDWKVLPPGGLEVARRPLPVRRKRVIPKAR